MPTSSGDGGEASGWSWDEVKAFENALATIGSDNWDEIAAIVSTKSAAEVRRYYEILAEDVEAIDAGKVPIPRYAGEEAAAAVKEKEQNGHGQSHQYQNNTNHGGFSDRRGLDGKACSKAEQERKKGIPWTEEEHRLFLLGLDKFGKGDWRSISRNFVVSRTPTQVASHAQKYFIRLNSMNRDRRRSSIHDITVVNGGEASPQGPITGQSNGNPPALVGSSSMKHPPQHPQHPPTMPGVGMYGPPMGHPVTGHMVSAVGTPVMLPPHGHAPYVMPVAYPVLPSTMHQ